MDQKGTLIISNLQSRISTLENPITEMISKYISLSEFFTTFFVYYQSEGISQLTFINKAFCRKISQARSIFLCAILYFCFHLNEKQFVWEGGKLNQNPEKTLQNFLK